MAQNQQLTRATELEQLAKKKLHRLGGAPCRALMAEKLPPGTNGLGGMRLQTNIYGCLVSKSKVYAYRYVVQINGVTERGAQLDFTSGSRDNVIKVERKRCCLIAFRAFYNTHENLFGKRHNAYDLSRILFTSEPINFNSNNLQSQFTVQQILDMQLFPELFVQQNLANIQHVNIRLMAAAGRGFEFELRDIQTAITRNLEEYNRSLLQYLDIYTAQWAMINPGEHIVFSSKETYLVNPQQHGYAVAEMPYFHSINAYPGAGARKDACFIEGPEGQGDAGQINCVSALVISSKITPFHDPGTNGNATFGNVFVKASRYNSNLGQIRLDDVAVDHLETSLKGLYVQTNYEPRQRFKIIALTYTTASDTFFPYGGIQISVADYYWRDRSIRLRYIHAPLLINQLGNYYPMELCVILDNQKVKMAQQTPAFSQEMINVCAVAPARLFEQNRSAVNSLQLENSPILDDGSIRFVKQPLVVDKARILPPPTIAYQQNNDYREVRTGSDNTWIPGRRFLHPSGCQKFVVLVQRDRPSERAATDRANFETFMKMFSDEARNLGMQIPPHEVIALPARTSSMDEVRSIREQFEKFAISPPKPDFVLIIHTRKDDVVHDNIKLEERRYGIVTQAILWETVIKIARKSQRITLQHILNKANIKLAGLNYCLAPIGCANLVQDKRLLIIGVGMSHFVRPSADSLLKIEGERGASTSGNGANGCSNGANGTANGYGNGANGDSTTMNGNGAQASRRPQPRASIIGFAANIGANMANFEFIGDYMVQEQYRVEKPDAMYRIIHYCVEIFIRNRRETPSRVIIYRHGSAEGDYKRILQYEVAFIKLALKKHNSDDAKLHIIACNKQHNVRFFRSDLDRRASAKEQNIRPGTVVDSQAVHPTRSEFYLNAHMALQGTAKTPRFTILLNESGPAMTMDIIQGITNHLCYGHQIVNSPTSLPSPLQIANLYADRGRRIYLRNLLAGGDNWTFDQVEANLCYRYSRELAHRRINA